MATFFLVVDKYFSVVLPFSGKFLIENRLDIALSCSLWMDLKEKIIDRMNPGW